MRRKAKNKLGIVIMLIGFLILGLVAIINLTMYTIFDLMGWIILIGGAITFVIITTIGFLMLR